MDGQVFGHYRLIEQIGAGGMGVVFRAHDEQLRRDVAVKILPHDLFSDAASRERFRKEALAVGRLNHPNIAMAFDFGEQSGVDYLVTEYIPGINLDEKIGKQPLPQKTVLELGIQILSGLEAAHRENVVHRDLKPGNIRLNRDGQVKILDFGLAKLAEPFDENADTVNLTSSVSISGTLPYMAPELLRAEEADARADIWAAGAVLYEMATGRRAFPDRQPSLVIDAILHYDPVRPTLINKKLTASLEAVILKALDRDPDRRYQSAREFRVDLQRLLAGGEIATDTLRQSQVVEVSAYRRQRKFVLVFLAVLLLGLAIGFFVNRWAPLPPAHQKILAVLPIETVGQDAATNALGLGLTETLTAKLVQASDGDAVQVVSSQDLRAKAVKNATDARREFGTDVVLEGSLQQAGPKLRIICNLVDSRTGRELATRTITTETGDIFQLQDQVVNEAIGMLSTGMVPKKARASVTPTTAPIAYEAYIRGRGYLQEYEKPENVDSAIGEFERAIQSDPAFSAAYAGLGEAYWIGYQQPMDRGKEWLTKAAHNCELSVKLDPQLAKAYACLGNIYYGTGQYQKAADQFQHAVDLDPVDDYVIGHLADAYEKLGKLSDAEAAYKKAISLRPNYWAVYNWLGYFYTGQGRYAEAAQLFQKVTELAPDNYRGYSNLGAIYVYEGQYESAAQVLQKSIDLRPSSTAYINLGATYYFLRKLPEAVDIYRRGIKLDDRSVLIWGNLGDALALISGRGSEASYAYRKGLLLANAQLEVNDKDITALALAAEYNAMLNDRTQAIAMAQRVLTLASSDPEVNVRAARVYNHFGDKEKALGCLEQAVKEGGSRFNIRDTPDFANLRTDPRFQKLMPHN